MIGVAVPIEGEAAERLGEIWRALGPRLAPKPGDIPHVSLHVAEEYQIDQAESALISLSHSQSPFSVFVAGFGLFSGVNPVVHLSVSRAPRLTVLHRAVALEVGRFSIGMDQNFAPTRWVPHITLTRAHVTTETVTEAVERLVKLDLAFELPVTALALIEDEGDGQRLLHRHLLTG